MLPPFILRLFPLILSVGLGTSIVKLFAVTLPAVAIPVPIIV